MKLGNVAISRKLGMGFGSVLVLLVLVSILSYTSIKGIANNAHGLIMSNDFTIQLDITEKDHVKWVEHVTALLTDDNINALNIETDDHKCRFGEWFYGEGRQSIETLFPSMVPILKKIEAPHEKLHKSAIAISENYKYEELISAVQAKEKIFHKFGELGENFTADLIKAMETIIDPAKSVAENEENIKEMIKWGEIDMEMNEGMIQPFLMLRIEVASMSQEQTDLQWNICLKQLKMVEQGVIDWSTLVTEEVGLNNVIKNLNTHILAFSVAMNDYTKAMNAEKEARASIDKAKKIYTEITVPALEDIRSILAEAKLECKNNAITEEVLLKKINSIEFNILVVNIVAFIIGISMAVLVARNIINPIVSAVGFIKELAKGVSLPPMSRQKNRKVKQFFGR